MSDYTLIIILTLVGFLLLAAILLVPVYLFLRREEDASERWTDEEVAKRSRQRSTNGSRVDEEGP